MSRRFKFCIHCRKTFTESEVNRGEFVKTRYGMLCLNCAERLEEEPAPAEAPKPEAAPEKPAEAPAPQPPPVPKAEESPAAPSEILRPTPAESLPVAAPPRAPAAASDEAKEIQRELARLNHQVETLQRMLLFDRSSPWAVAGVVAECVSVGLLLVAVFNWLDGPGNLLLAAILAQVMALTFFVRSR